MDSVQPSLTTVSQLQYWTEVLQTRAGEEAMETVEEDGRAAGASGAGSSPGSVTLSQSEALSLLSVLQNTLDTFLEAPLTRNDLLSLVLHLGQQQSTLFTPPPAPPRRPYSRDLPADILELVFAELRGIRSEMPDESVLGGNSGAFAGWKEMRVMSGVNKNWRSVARPLYLAEIHVADARRFPGLSKFLFKNPARADCLTRIHIKVYDFEYSFGKSSEDAGFALPSVISLATNLHTLSIQSERSGAVSSYRRRTREVHSLDTFTGGVHLPEIIAERKQLRTLVYGAPCTMDDIALFTTQLPELRSLDLTGDIDSHSSQNHFQTCSPQLRRFWAPTASLSPSQLSRLFKSSRVDSLAFTFDIDAYWEATQPTEEQTIKVLAKLTSFFEKLGPQLQALLLASPFHDLESGRMRMTMPPGGWNGFGGGGGGIAARTIQIAFQTNVGGIAGGGPPAPAAGAPAGGVAAGPAPPAPAAIGGLPPPLAGALPAAAAGGPPPPPGANFALFPFPNIAPEPPTPFFEEVIAHCPALTHLELYGRRYSPALLDEIKFLPLSFLAISLPRDENRVATFEGILGVLDEGEGFKELRRLELHGEWEATERRAIKEACDRRGIGYASVGTSRG